MLFPTYSFSGIRGGRERRAKPQVAVRMNQWRGAGEGASQTMFSLASRARDARFSSGFAVGRRRPADRRALITYIIVGSRNTRIRASFPSATFERRVKLQNVQPLAGIPALEPLCQRYANGAELVVARTDSEQIIRRFREF